jgi:hypothetical protein
LREFRHLEPISVTNLRLCLRRAAVFAQPYRRALATGIGMPTLQIDSTVVLRATAIGEKFSRTVLAALLTASRRKQPFDARGLSGSNRPEADFRAVVAVSSRLGEKI